MKETRVKTSSMDRSRLFSHHRRRCHHHHHHHHHACCHHHHHHHHCSRHLLCPSVAPLPLQYSQSTYCSAPQIDLNFQPNSSKPTPAAIPLVVEEDAKQNELDNGNEEDEDDPIFVLTDEWREFFAKSEAKRKLEKQQAKKDRKSRSGKTVDARSS